jgi:hypothetical protein
MNCPYERISGVPAELTLQKTLGIFGQPAKNDFFSKLQVHIPSDLIDTPPPIEYTPKEKRRKRM